MKYDFEKIKALSDEAQELNKISAVRFGKTKNLSASN